MIKLLLPTLLLGLFAFNLEAQAVKVQACARTTDVDPVKDNNGNDRRHLSAFYLDKVIVEEFGTANPKTYAEYGVNGAFEWDSQVWVNGCQNNQSQGSCDGCNKCEFPTVNGGTEGGVILGDIENNVRVRSENNNMIIEATNEKDVCYETPWIDIKESEGKFAYITVAFNGTTTNQDTRTMNVKLNYIFLDDGEVRNFLNIWSNFEQPRQEEVRTVVVTSANDLSEDVTVDLSPNPATEELRIALNSQRVMSLDATIVDLNGKTIIERTSEIQSGSNNLTIDVSAINSGSYFLLLSDGERRMAKQFVKK